MVRGTINRKNNALLLGTTATRRSIRVARSQFAWLYECYARDPVNSVISQIEK